MIKSEAMVEFLQFSFVYGWLKVSSKECRLALL
jgi:hypothetical protein